MDKDSDNLKHAQSDLVLPKKAPQAQKPEDPAADSLTLIFSGICKALLLVGGLGGTVFGVGMRFSGEEERGLYLIAAGLACFVLAAFLALAHRAVAALIRIEHRLGK